MHIAFFDTHRYDRESFELANAHFGHALRFLEPRLTGDTVVLAIGCQAVCVFVNDVVDASVLAILARLGVRVIALRCTGYNHVNLAAAKAHGISVVRVPFYTPHSMAEHTVALMLALNRQTHKAHERLREGYFAIDGLIGFELHGRTAGIVGTGRVGSAVARILNGFGCRLLAHDLDHSPEVEKYAEYVPLERLLAESDLITLHCPLTPLTHHLIDEVALERMKPGVMLINTGRAGLLDLPAVSTALKEGRIGQLGLDVCEEGEGGFEELPRHGIADEVLARLLTFPNVLVTNHQAFLTREALAVIAETTLANIAAIERGAECVNRVVAAETHG